MQPPNSGHRFLLPTAEDLRQLRLEKGLSQVALAKLAGEGFSQPLIARIEKGTVNPPLSKVRRLLEVLYNEKPKGDITAKDIAAKPVIMVRGEDRVSDAIKIIGDKGVSQVPVCDAGGKIIGGLTEKTLAESLTAQGKSALQQPVSEIMEAPFPEIRAGASIGEIQEQLPDGPALVVKEGEKVIGILTKTDLLQYFRSLQAG
jgi:predicted transcriptional regulator